MAMTDPAPCGTPRKNRLSAHPACTTGDGQVSPRHGSHSKSHKQCSAALGRHGDCMHGPAAP
ncbi:MAG: hypothetical protein ACJ8G3_18145 [Burkholderiaceae bacterium]